MSCSRARSRTSCNAAGSWTARHGADVRRHVRGPMSRPGVVAAVALGALLRAYPVQQPLVHPELQQALARHALLALARHDWRPAQLHHGSGFLYALRTFYTAWYACGRLSGAYRDRVDVLAALVTTGALAGPAVATSTASSFPPRWRRCSRAITRSSAGFSRPASQPSAPMPCSPPTPSSASTTRSRRGAGAVERPGPNITI